MLRKRRIVELWVVIILSCLWHHAKAQTNEEKLQSLGSVHVDSASSYLLDPLYSLFFIGNTGSSDSLTLDANLKVLHKQLLEAGANSTLIFLGDNSYPLGIPDSEDRRRPEAEKRLHRALGALKDYHGKVIFTPGDKDWANSGKEGWNNVQNEEEYISDKLGADDVFFPQDGCPGPVEINVDQNIVLIILNTQWFLHPWDKAKAGSGCEFKSSTDIYQQLDDMMERNKDKIILVAAHHPMYTYGRHNGYSTWKTNIFPLTDLSKGLYIPLPGLAQLYTGYRALIGGLQDTHNTEYHEMVLKVTRILRKYPNSIYLSAHENNLQYIFRDSIHYIISGSGSIKAPLGKGAYARFGAAENGFARLDEFGGGKLNLTFFEPLLKDTMPAYRTMLFQKQPVFKSPVAVFRDSLSGRPDSVTVALSDIYKAGKVKKYLLGKNYREDFTQKVKMPVFDIGSVHGGMKILQLGGGNQSKTLRLADSSGTEYALRSVNKDPSILVPDFLKETVAQDIVQDQMSAMEPFGPSIIPPLADAMKVPHAVPTLYYIPDDKRFGIYQGRFAGTIAYLEEREPGADDKHKSYNTLKLLKRLDDDNDYSINQKAVLKARMLDILIGDWDRHDDQWRWLGEKVKGGTRYYPVPRDRDMAFFVNEGLIPRFLGADYFVPEIQGFGYKIGDVTTLYTDAQRFDRSFLNELSEHDWLKMAAKVQSELPDKVIEEAVGRLPDSVFKRDGAILTGKIKQRRNDLQKYALQYYRFLAKNVDVLGSKKREYFKVDRLNDSLTHVQVFKINKDGDTTKTLYDRTFDRKITSEIRLFGQRGDDVFKVDGDVRKGILVRIIGGEGNDSISDQSRVRDVPFSKTRIYDTRQGNRIDLGKEGSDHTSSNPAVNNYDRRAFAYYYNTFIPQLSFAYNPDDGIFLGGGILYKTNGFRKEPYSTLQTLTGNYAVATNAFNFKYKGEFMDVIGKADLQILATLKDPNFVTNFYGLGNSSVYDKANGVDYYRVRFNQYSVTPLLKFKFAGKQSLVIGPEFERVKVQPNAGRFISNFQANGLDSVNLFQPKAYGGFKIVYSIDTRNSPNLTFKGLYFHVEYNAWAGLKKASSSYSSLNSNVNFYYSWKLPALLTFATRFGEEMSFGHYQFFQAGSLGEETNLRGFRRNRFSGKTAAFNNTELRYALFKIRSYVLPSSVGLVAFNDVGKVWYTSGNNHRWHDGYGGGLYIAPFSRLVFNVLYGISDDDHLLLLKSGFFF